MKHRLACAAVGFLSLIVSLAAQTASNTPAPVPPLIQFSHIATDEGGNSLSGMVSITFSLYSSQQGSEPLWIETQSNVQLNATGHYSVQLGVTKPNGVPTTLFTTGEARWLGVRIAEQAEQPRILLLSVPYALKAGDAATIGGLPPSAFVLAAPAGETAASESVSTASATSGVTPAVAGTGTADFIPLWTDSAGDLGNSALFQSGTSPTARLGINTTTPATALDVKGSGTIRGSLTTLGTLLLPATSPGTATAGESSEPLNLAASAFNSTSSTAVNQTFQWQAEAAGNDTSSPSGTLNLLFGTGATKPAETGLHIASDGQITFATEQTFPGTGTGNGTVISVASGAGLTGGPITGSGTLSLAANACASGKALTALPFTCSPVATLATNIFTGNQTVDGSTNMIGDTRVDFEGLNKGSVSPAVRFGSGPTGEAISSDRAGTVNVKGIDLYTNNAARLSVTNGGSVGIGTQAPAYTFEVSSAGSTVAQMAMVSNGTDAAISVNNTASGGREYWIDSGSGIAGVGAGNFAVYDRTATSTRLVVSSAGNVGIGTTAPAALLDVRGPANFLSTVSGANAVTGQTSSPTGIGVYGYESASTGTSEGVLGGTASPSGYGVYGVNQSSEGTTAGVFGGTGSATGYGVWGANQSGTNISSGVYGTNSSPEGYGVWGVGGLVGVYGQAVEGNSSGVAWNAYQGNAGVWGDAGTGSPGTVAGVMGTGYDANAGFFFNSSGSDVYFTGATVWALNDSNATGAVALYAGGSEHSCWITSQGTLGCFGTIGNAADVDSGARKVALYAMQSPENWFEDAGSGQLSNGSAGIHLDPTFAQTVNAGAEYHVFLTPKGDCKGLYVTNETATGFEVHELGGGTSSIAFDYRIMAKRKGYENVRLAELPDREGKQAEQRQRMRRPVRPSTLPGTSPMTQIPQLKAAAQPATAQSK
jgi:hypothetical protein